MMLTSNRGLGRVRVDLSSRVSSPKPIYQLRNKFLREKSHDQWPWQFGKVSLERLALWTRPAAGATAAV